MLITALDRFRPEGLWEARNEVEPQSPANELVDFPRAHSDSYHNALNLLIFQSIWMIIHYVNTKIIILFVSLIFIVIVFK